MKTYYDLLDRMDALFTGLRAVILRKAGQDELVPPHKRATNLKDRLIDQALERYDNIVGRFDSMDKVPSRNLVGVMGQDEADWLISQGVTTEDGHNWVVPEGMDLDQFEPWWPTVPEDLCDKTPRLVATKTGRAIEGYVLPEDRAKGADSTATSIMYLAFPVIGALAFLMGQGDPKLMFVSLLLLVPYAIALAQGEGVGESVKSFFFLTAIPLLLALLSSKGLDLGQFAGKFAAGGLATLGLGAIGLVIGALLLFTIVAFFMDRFDSKRRAGVLGGTWDKLKSISSWALVYGVAFTVSHLLLPAYLQPAFYFAMACLYPMVYTNANYVARSALLKEHGEAFNLSAVGALTTAHVAARQEQSKNAYKDKTPLFDIGVATGWLTKKHYPYAPDENATMRLSALDFTMHLIVFGMTGSRKTSAVMRPIAKQWVESRFGGFVCLCGKGSLPGEISSLIEIMVRPGVDFAPFQGLTGHGVATALNSLAKSGGSDPRSKVWEEGANNFIDNAATLWQALFNHEAVKKRYAANMFRTKELEEDMAQLESIRLDKLGQDNAEVLKRLSDVRRQKNNWKAYVEKPRQWLWNVDTFVKVCNAINAVQIKGGKWVPGTVMETILDDLGYLATKERASGHPNTIHPEIGRDGLLDSTLDFVVNTWPSYEPQQRSSFFINVNQRILPLTRGLYLTNSQGVHWKTLEKGLDVGRAMYGASVGVDLPETKHGDAGAVIAALVKQRIYTAVNLRASDENWRKDGQKDLMLMVDECQLAGCSDAERKILPVARSLGMCAVMATQGFESLEASMGDKTKAIQFVNTFQNMICLRSSQQTYNYMAERLGTAQMVVYEQQGVGLDMRAGVRKLANSPLNDTDHPNRAALRKMERLGAGKLVVASTMGTPTGKHWTGHSQMRLLDENITNHIVVPQGGTKQILPVFLPEEYSALTIAGQAIVMLNRAGEKRVDVAVLNSIREDELRRETPEAEEAETA